MHGVTLPTLHAAPAPTFVSTAFGDVTFTSDMPVELLNVSAPEAFVMGAAQASTGNDQEYLTANADRMAGMISYLARQRHGSPFEHVSMTFAISAPIFVFRELMRHRIASYNEASARYMTMSPVFYEYPEHRPLEQHGKGAHPKLGFSEDHQSMHLTVVAEDRAAAIRGWEAYQRKIAAGAALEVARSSLPVSLYSRLWVTVNLRSLMNFLSLRVDGGEDAYFDTKPQWEIEQVALHMEALFAEQYPAVHAAFMASKRVAP